MSNNWVSLDRINLKEVMFQIRLQAALPPHCCGMSAQPHIKATYGPRGFVNCNYSNLDFAFIGDIIHNDNPIPCVATGRPRPLHHHHPHTPPWKPLVSLSLRLHEWQRSPWTRGEAAGNIKKKTKKKTEQLLRVLIKTRASLQLVTGRARDPPPPPLRPAALPPRSRIWDEITSAGAAAQASSGC